MTKIHRKLLSVTTALALSFNMVTPVMASSASITGNGYMSENDIDVETNSNTVVQQSNVAVVTNSVSAQSKTGGNTASYNTGGDSFVFTGNAGSWVTVANNLNTNSAEVACCDDGGFDIAIDGNGARSENDVDYEVGEGGKPHAKVVNVTDTLVKQDNNAFVVNNVEADAKTGYNDANYNTGGASVIMTGAAESRVGVSTTANRNWASVGGGSAEAESGLSAYIGGNGYDSENDIEIDLEKTTGVFQNNFATVLNDVESDAATGKNDAKYNTGGDVLVETGSAISIAGVENKLNFNWADVSCCAVFDAELSIWKNGAKSDNKIDLDLDSDRSVVQGNKALVTNLVESTSGTGKNDADKNTGGEVGIMTGHAKSMVGILNELNFNYASIDCCDFGLTADIGKNGAFSESDIEIDRDSSRQSFQDNMGLLTNLVGGEWGGAYTGYNDADYNTGDPEGDPGVMTGNALAMTTIANSLNINSDDTSSVVIPGLGWEFQFVLNWAHMGSMFGWW